MADHWGVDSVAGAHEAVPAATGKVTLYDHLVAKGLEPEFFGRYLSGGTKNLTKAEVTFLHNKGCRILPVYRNGAIAGKNGTVEAGRAIDLANALGMAGGVVIYTDIEPLEKPSVDYILGWCKTMRASKYGGSGGFYCNNWSGSDFMKAFKPAFEKMDETMRNGIYLWCQHPPKKCGKDSSFNPEKPAFFPSGPNVWQYAINCLTYKQVVNGVTKTWGLIDMNSADTYGFEVMWK